MSQSIDLIQSYSELISRVVVIAKIKLKIKKIGRTRNWIPSKETDLEHCFRMR